MKISVVINTFNAERCLESVLKSVVDYDEILLCDMHSEDRTIEIAEKYNCRIIYHERTGIVEPARQFAISQAKHGWVLVVDADECVPSGLKDFLIKTVEENPDVAAIRLPLKNYFMGRIMHGNYPDHVTRFMRKDKVEWPAKIHTRPIINGRIFLVPGKRKDIAFIHNGAPSLKARLAKTNSYSSMEIDRRKKRSNGFIALLFAPATRFFRSYILKGGFRDGIPGLIWAIDAAIYKFYATAKAAESAVTVEDYEQDFLSYFGEDLRRTEKTDKK